MLFYSLHHQSPPVSFREAAIQGQAPDKGLYFPSNIPLLDAALVRELKTMPIHELCYRVMQPYVGDSMDEYTLRDIIEATINFPFPLVKVNDQAFALELFHGPTLAFKDVGARFMSRCLGYFSKNNHHKLTVLVATSGDTGGAVANGFLGVEGVEVVILYPSGKVSPVQELQLTTCGQNITALEVAGTFDDCQAMVKEAFMDPELQLQYQLTSANSINVARWLPQQFYYFMAYQAWPYEGAIPVVSVPSGNFGNIGAGLLARSAGLPIDRLIAACNINDTVTEYLQTGIYQPKSAVNTVSNAMDVGNPSNLVRIQELFGGSVSGLNTGMQSAMISDAQTIAVMKEVYDTYAYQLDPHGAVAYTALMQQLEHASSGIFLATAHPVKFPSIIEQAVGSQPDIPASIKFLFDAKKESIQIKAGFSYLKEWMLSRDHH
jgi:threonine synthase